MIISKFWSRIGALLIDITVLGILGMILGFSFNDLFVQMGQYGLFIGLVISIAYFTISNSKLLKGQTLGKKAVGIVVVTKEGEYLSPFKSFLRALILCSGYILINFKIPTLAPDSFISTVFSLFFISLLFCIVVFYILNKSNRQSLHDIIIGSYVISKEKKEGEIINSEPSRLAYYVSCALIIIIFSTYFFFFKGNADLQNLNSTYSKLSQIDGVLNAGFSSNTTTFNGDKTTTTKSYKAVLWVIDLPTRQSDIEKLEVVKEAITIILNSENEANTCDYINITLARGFNIGIAKGNRTFNLSKTPTEWKELIK